VRSDKTLRKWYKRINKRFFDGKLPDNVCVRWADVITEPKIENEDFGDTNFAEGYHCYRIILSRKLNVSANIRLSSPAGA
jgi:hypothetical protein